MSLTTPAQYDCSPTSVKLLGAWAVVPPPRAMLRPLRRAHRPLISAGGTARSGLAVLLFGDTKAGATLTASHLPPIRFRTRRRGN